MLPITTNNNNNNKLWRFRAQFKRKEKKIKHEQRKQYTMRSSITEMLMDALQIIKIALNSIIASTVFVHCPNASFGEVRDSKVKVIP